jgi:hypothetical protein
LSAALVVLAKQMSFSLTRICKSCISSRKNKLQVKIGQCYIGDEWFSIEPDSYSVPVTVVLEEEMNNKI